MGKLNQIKQWFSNLPTNIKTFITETIPGYFQELVGDEEAGTGVMGKIAKIKKFFTDLPTKIETFITKDIPAFFQTLVGSEENETGVMGKIGKIKKFFTNLPEGIKTFITETIPGFFSDFVGDEKKKTGVLGTLEKIKTWFTDLPTTITTSFATIGSTIADGLRAGLNAIRGIWNRAQLDVTIPDNPITSALGLAGRGFTIGTPDLPEFNAGGMVKYAAGGVAGDGSRDSIAAMLTPGEFVVRKAMVDKYGTPMFDAINQGSFAMPTYKRMESTAGNVSVKTENNTSVFSPMYNNYSVNVSVSNTGASADEIANKTMTKIRQMQNMQIRSGRGN
jgi:hypothetical protein